MLIVPFTVGADRPSSRFNETVLKILCPPSPNPRPGLTRRCSRSSTAASTPYPPLQPSRPGLTRRCSTSSLILRTCQVRLTSVSSRCASRSRILQMHPRQVRIAPASSKCASHSRVHVSSVSTSLLQVHFSPRSASPASKFTSASRVLPFSSECATIQWW